MEMRQTLYHSTHLPPPADCQSKAQPRKWNVNDNYLPAVPLQTNQRLSTYIEGISQPCLDEQITRTTCNRSNKTRNTVSTDSTLWVCLTKLNVARHYRILPNLDCSDVLIFNLDLFQIHFACLAVSLCYSHARLNAVYIVTNSNVCKDYFPSSNKFSEMREDLKDSILCPALNVVCERTIQPRGHEVGNCKLAKGCGLVLPRYPQPGGPQTTPYQQTNKYLKHSTQRIFF